MDTHSNIPRARVEVPPQQRQTVARPGFIISVRWSERFRALRERVLMNTKSDKARILLINPTGWQKESVNLGLAYLAGALRKAGHSAVIFDLIRRDMNDAELLDRVQAFAPTLIGISVKTATARESGRLAEMLSSAYRDSYILAGGPHVTLCPEDYLADYHAFDFGLMGESEESIVLLADAIASGTSVQDVPGLAHRVDGNVAINPWRPPDDLDKLTLPDFDAIDGFCWDDFRYPLLTSRGCPFQCVYCCVNKLTGSKKWRSRSARNVVDELESVVGEKGIDSFEIWDDNFTLNVSRAKSICRELIERKLNLSWYCHNGIRADRIDDELAALMKQAGCTSIAFGMESGHPKTFDLINKGEPLSAITDAVKTVKAAGIDAVGYFIIGLPGDTLDRFIETVRFSRAMNLKHTVFGMLVPYPQTEVWDMVADRGKMLVDITQTQHFSADVVPVVFEMPEFPQEDMIRAFHIAKYFELYDAAKTLIERGENPVVVYMESEEIVPMIPGMVTACDAGVKHVIVSDPKATSSPSYEIKGADVVVVDQPSKEIFADSSVIFVCTNRQVTMRILFSNSYIVGVRPDRSNQPLTTLRKSVIPSRGLPQIALSLFGSASAARDTVKRIGMRRTLRAVARPLFKALPMPMQERITGYSRGPGSRRKKESGFRLPPE